MRPDMYRVTDRVYGLRNGRRILVATPGDELPLDEARELGLVSEPVAAAVARKPAARKRSKKK